MRDFFSEYSKCNAVENNLGESFNAAIRNARTKPVVEMLEEIRRRVMVCNDRKRLEADREGGVYTPRAIALLDQHIELAKNCRSLPCGLGKYEVNYFNDRYVVHLRNETSCTCRLYLISGISCCHIASALRLERNADQDPKTLISDWFTVEKLRRCYATGLKPVNGMNLWEITTDVMVNPPPYKRPPGRPLGKQRRREKGEKKPAPKLAGFQPKKGIKMHCRNCGQEGHNILKCKNVAVPKPAKKNPSRPHTKAVVIEALNQAVGVGSSYQPVHCEEWMPWSDVRAGSSSQPVQREEWMPWSDVGAGSSSQSVHREERQHSNVTDWDSWFNCGLGSSSQPTEDLPSLSAALPRRKRGRPRKNQAAQGDVGGGPPNPKINRDRGRMQLPREGFGIFTSPETGDDYIHLGMSVRDTSDNTILPSSLFRAREAKKLAVARSRGRGCGSSQP